MGSEFKSVVVEDIDRLRPFYGLRPDKTCDSVFLDYFLWRDYYHIKCAVGENKAVLWLIERDGQTSTVMPIYREEDLSYFFHQPEKYFATAIYKPFYTTPVGEETMQCLGLGPREHEMEEQVDPKDYLHDGEVMRILPGKKLHKKKNRLNAFKWEYEGGYEYERLCYSNRHQAWEFIERWRRQKADGDVLEDSLEYGVAGTHEALKNCSSLRVRVATVYANGQMEAFTIGGTNERESMTAIYIEKTNPDIKGLYQFTNQQSPVDEFPNAALVNREDDVGTEGLRKTKMSYNPIGFAKKYMVRKR